MRMILRKTPVKVHSNLKHSNGSELKQAKTSFLFEGVKAEKSQSQIKRD